MTPGTFARTESVDALSFTLSLCQRHDDLVVHRPVEDAEDALALRAQLHRAPGPS